MGGGNDKEEMGGEGGERESKELSVPREEGRAQGDDGLQAGSEVEAKAQAAALCNGSRKGGCGAQRGANQKGRSE